MSEPRARTRTGWREARRARRAVRTPLPPIPLPDEPSHALVATLARYLAKPAGVMQARPAPRHCAPGHGAERSRFGRGAEVNVKDHSNEEADEGDVVQNDGDLPKKPGEAQREPHRNSRDQKPDRAEADRPEEKLLAAVVLSALLGRLLFPSHVARHCGRTPPPFLIGSKVHVAEPVEELEGRGDHESHTRVGVDDSRDF